MRADNCTLTVIKGIINRKQCQADYSIHKLQELLFGSVTSFYGAKILLFITLVIVFNFARDIQELNQTTCRLNQSRLYMHILCIEIAEDYSQEFLI